MEAIKKQLFIILVSEPDMETYVLDEAHPSVESVRQAMMVRAEELIDEQVSYDAEVEEGEAPCGYTYTIVDNQNTIYVEAKNSEGKIAGRLATFWYSAVTPVDSLV